MSTIVIACILAVIPYAGQESKASVDKEVLSQASLSNPYLRSHVVEILAEQSRAAKAGAWRKAQKLGWHVKGHSDGAYFELMTLMDGRPIYNITNNVNAAISTAAHLVRNTTPYNVNGGGFIVGVWDAGGVLPTHQEFDGRVAIFDGADSHWHSTHVGGTIGAVGIQPNAMGMAPDANIASYDWDLASSEMTDRAASYPEEPNKIYLSNHSYGIATGWKTGDYSGNYGFHWFGVWGDREADGFGQYSSETVTWDSICYSAPYYLPFKSAGNDRGDYVPSEGETFYYYDGGVWQSKTYNSSTDPYADNWDNGGFDTIPHRGNAKNIMTVGAVGDAVFLGERSLANGVMTIFSSWGPTDDGRIKPDIVANGADLYSCTDDSDSSYDTFSGTSMAAPDAAGSATLLAEYYGRLFGGEAMRSSTLKGLIIHTADDLGNTGPDYSFGWGLMNTKAAAEQIREHSDHPSEHKIVEGLLDAGNLEDSYTFGWNAEDPIRATLCWTDPPAEALVELDNPSPRLLNDLDLRVIDPCSSLYYPFVLDPGNPAEAATTGDNTVDNVEQVLIGTPPVEGIYTVEVSYKGTLTNNAQHYSLIISGQHHLPGPTGIILLDKDTYSCDDLLEIELRDGNLVGNDTQAILVSTNGADSETVTLYEDSYRGGVFTGTIRTESEAVDPEDGMLQVGHGQIITAIYEDANTETGDPATVTDIAEADCQRPLITNVQAKDITSSGALVTFETDEATTARIKYGLTCNAPSIIIDDPTLMTEHGFYLSGLMPETDYYLELVVWDSVDNETTDDNGGLCYQFTTSELLPGIRVPDDYATIQEAIDAANNGDTIIVADGIYTGNGNRDIDFKGKAITIKSENGPGNCIIDCQGSSSSPHRGFHFHNGEGKDSIVSGFTIKNGFGPEEGLPGEMGTVYLPAGGAIFCESSSPTINNCIFSDNKVLNPDYHNFSRGGAIACTSASPTISSSTFADNEAGCDGGAIYGYSGALTIANCNFNSNISHRHGGAIECERGSPRIENCTISNNRSYGYGGGIYCDDSAATIINCVINNNTAYDPGMGGASGGGMELECNRGQVIEVINCTIIGNWAENSGGGLRTSCCGDYEVVNSIVWNNFPGQINALHETVVTYSNIQGGFAGYGNIDEDPNFVSATDYHLTAGSPCIDAGTNDVLSGFPPRDLDGTPRPLDGDDNQTDIADMGAYEYWSGPSAPFIAIECTQFGFFALDESCQLEDQVLSIRNGWAGTILNWQITEDCPWLEVVPTGGTSVGDINEVILRVVASGLLDGDYSCLLVVSDSNAANNPQCVSVKLRVGPRLVPEEYPTIQEAIDAVFAREDIILVADGTYTGDGNKNIDVKGKTITVMSESGPENCIIDCQNAGIGFYFHSGETQSSVIKGFTITNASSGGIYCVSAAPTMINCIISDNNGGGIDCLNSSPVIENCVISGNSGSRGGGINCNSSSPEIINCLITGNSGGYGGGIACMGDYRTSKIINCTISHNTGGMSGAIHLITATATITNCILWDNSPFEIGMSATGTAFVTYSNVQDSWTGEGNIEADPLFAAPDDYHLVFGSPCIDTGTNGPPGGLPTTDLDGILRPFDGNFDGTAVADMGAYELQRDPNKPVLAITPASFEFYSSAIEPSTSPQSLFIWNATIGTLNWQITEYCNWAEVSPTSGESSGETDEVIVSVNPESLSFGEYSCILTISDPCDRNNTRLVIVKLLVDPEIHVPGDFQTIQDAINSAFEGCEVIVADGVYIGSGNRNIDFKGKAITVRSENGPDNCIIDCQNSTRGFSFHSGEGPDSILDGFTITNGYSSEYAGGIYCNNVGTEPTIRNCVVTGNRAHSGGGIACVRNSPTIVNCRVTNNEAYYDAGGGILCWEMSDPVIIGCKISNNQAKHQGGGLYVYAHPSIVNCTIANNKVTDGSGGGIFFHRSSSTVTNCIVWGNTASSDSQIKKSSYGSVTVLYSDVQGGFSGVGNINLYPSFVDAMNYDYHLLWDSPCIDAGDPNYASEPDETDIDGEPRVMDGRVDIGADEVGEKQSDFSKNGVVDSDDLNILTQAWLSQTGSPNWNEICDLFSDGQITFPDFAEFAKDWLWQASWFEP